MEPSLYVAAADQWMATTTGRIATDAFSWRQAVHWVTESGLYKPRRKHGPGWGPTTVAIAHEISALKECRPGIDYLARKLNVSERTVQYHLGMLREAGLLVYRVKGTRISGAPNQASVFERVIPVEFDEALGIRTIGEGVQRRPVGIAEESRTLIGKLAKKATRKVRRTRRKRTRSSEALCTPMQGGTSGSSSTGITSLPPETDKLASGEADCPTPKTSKRRPRKLNKIGRRYQLAKELITLVPWLGRASVARIAWIVRDVADAGWTVDEVRAAVDVLEAVDTVHRPSGYLAHKLEGVHDLWNTPARRRQLLEDWRDTRRSTAARHDEYRSGDAEGPQSIHVRKLVNDAFTSIGQIPSDLLNEATEVTADDAIGSIEDLTRDDVIAMRVEGQKNPELIRFAIEGLGEADARRLYTNTLVDQVLKTYAATTVIH